MDSAGVRPGVGISRAGAMLVFALLALGAGPALAQVKGPNTCFKCHKPARATWETTAPFHRKSIDQLSAPKAAAYAAAIGLASPMTVTGKAGDCVSCHATSVGGAPAAGVSCETCHGPGTGYFTPHQEPEFYDKPEGQWLGLRNLFKRPAAIAAMCVDCHITPDPRLKKAGHPAGEKFDAGKGLQKMVHWDSGVSLKRRRDTYDAAFFAQVGSDGARLAAKRLPSGASVAAGPAPAAAPRPAPGAAPQPAPGAAPPAPAAAPPAPAAASRPRPLPTGAPDPFDWDQPVAELPPDYPGVGGAPAAESAPAPPASTAAARPPVAAVPPPAAPRTASTAPELPAVPTEPVVPAPAPAGARAARVVRPPAARVAELRGRSAQLLATLLKAHAGQLDLDAPAPPREFLGPDGELLRIQDEILYLAVEALRRKPN